MTQAIDTNGIGQLTLAAVRNLKLKSVPAIRNMC